MGDTTAHRIAAIDIGSNSIHLTVADVSSDRVVVLHKEKMNARLGDKRNAQAQLPLPTIRDAIDVLECFRARSGDLKAEIRVGATASLRQAKNRDEFISMAAARGIRVTVIDEITEAILVRRGALFGLPSFKACRTLCVDVGGGSTEVSLGHGASLIAVTSLPLGGLTIQRRLGHDPIPQNRFKVERSHLRRQVRRALQSFVHFQIDHVIATGGTIQRLAHVHTAQHDDDVSTIDGLTLSHSTVQQLTRRLRDCRSNVERLELPGIDPSRADVLLGGSLIFSVLGDVLGVRDWTVSMSAMRTGMLISQSWP